MPPVMKRGRHGNWADLPPELMSSILLRIDVLENAQRVCRSWRRVCKDPRRGVRLICATMETWTTWTMTSRSCVVTQSIAAKAVWLGSTLGTYFGTDDLLNYIAVRSSNLRSLRLLMCDTLTDEGFMEAVAKLPLLEHLEISYCSLSEEDFLKAAGQSCPNLKTLKLNSEPQFKPDDD
ncbi:unnamed protein product [Brassica oleracea var. botrytis]